MNLYLDLGTCSLASSSPHGYVPLLELDDGKRHTAKDKLATRFDELDAQRAEGLSK